MFNGCSSLRKLDVSGFDTSRVTNMRHMFFNDGNLRQLDVSRLIRVVLRISRACSQAALP